MGVCETHTFNETPIYRSHPVRRQRGRHRACAEQSRAGGVINHREGEKRERAAEGHYGSLSLSLSLYIYIYINGLYLQVPAV